MLRNIIFLSIFIGGCQYLQTNHYDREESFEFFLERFSSDSVYQIDHVNFPLFYEYLNDLYEVESRAISKSNYMLLNFRDDHLARKREADAYEIKVLKLSKEKVTYIRSGIDNGMLIEFHFELHNGEWYLFKIFNRST